MAGTPRYRAIGVPLFSISGRVLLPRSVPVGDGDDERQVGDAVRTGALHFAAADVEHQRPEMLWRLTIGGQELPGSFVLRAGEFHAIGATS